MPRAKHNTVDEIFYPRSFGARNVVQDRSKGGVSITNYFCILSVSICFVRDCVSTTGKPTRVRNCILGRPRGVLHPAVVIPTKIFGKRSALPNDDEDAPCHICMIYCSIRSF